MTVRVTERRMCMRFAAAFPVVLTDARGRIVGRGRTADVSEGGVFVLLNRTRTLKDGTFLLALITVPGLSDSDARTGGTRQVCYRCRLVRQKPMGTLQGLGLEFMQKL